MFLSLESFLSLVFFQKLKDENDLLLAKEEEIGEFRATCESYETEVQRLSNGYKDLVQKSVGHEVFSVMIITSRNVTHSVKGIDHDYLLCMIRSYG